MALTLRSYEPHDFAALHRLDKRAFHQEFRIQATCATFDAGISGLRHRRRGAPRWLRSVERAVRLRSVSVFRRRTYIQWRPKRARDFPARQNEAARWSPSTAMTQSADASVKSSATCVWNTNSWWKARLVQSISAGENREAR